MANGRPVSIYLSDDVRRILDGRTPPGSSRSRTLEIIVRRFDEMSRASSAVVGRSADVVPADRIGRRSKARDISSLHAGMDEGDVEHALSNLLLPPRERMKKRIGNGGLRSSPK